MHFSMTSICDADFQFNDGTSERYHLLIYHKELEPLKNIWAWKAAAIKITTQYKKQYQISLSLRKKKNHKSDTYHKYFQIKLSILPMNHHCDAPLYKILFTNRFNRNTYCTGSGGNFVHSFSILRNRSIQSYSATYACVSLTS